LNRGTGTSTVDAVSVAADRRRVCDTTVRGRGVCRLFAGTLGLKIRPRSA